MLFVRIVFILVAVYFGVKALIWLNRYVKSLSAGARARERRDDAVLEADEMVRDPVCGV